MKLSRPYCRHLIPQRYIYLFNKQWIFKNLTAVSGKNKSNWKTWRIARCRYWQETSPNGTLKKTSAKVASLTMVSTNGRKPNGRKTEDREPVPNTVHYSPEGIIFQEAFSTRLVTGRPPSSPAPLMPEYTTAEASSAQLSPPRCGASPGRNITGKPEKTRRKIPFGNAWLLQKKRN